MNKQSFKFTIEPWVIKKECLEYTTKIFKLFKRDMKLLSENHEATFYAFKMPDWVNIIALTNNDEIILVEQFRYGTLKPTLELPGGIIDPGELPAEAAARELLEETGYSGSSIENLGKVSSNPAIQNNYTYTILIKNCTKQTTQHLDENERINIHKMPFKDYLNLVANGTINHALIVAATAKYLLYNSK